MHARELVELAATVSFRAAAFLDTAQPVAVRFLADYWSASRCRVDRWGLVLRDFTVAHEMTRPEEADQLWQGVRPVLTEILLSETLTRVWTGLSTAYDQRADSVQMEPVARAVHVAHLEARHRTLNLLACGRGFALRDAVVLNQLRRRIESWTDALLAPVYLEHEVGPLAFSETRCREFATELADQRRAGLNQSAKRLTLRSLKAAFHATACYPSPNPDLNRDIATAVRGCLDGKPSTEASLPDSGWLERMLQMADETQAMIDQLYALEGMQHEIN